MSEHVCPPIDDLMHADVSDGVLDHASSCVACAAVVDLVATTRRVDLAACEEQEVALSELFSGEVSGERGEALQLHLQQCEGCNRAALRLVLSQRELDDIPEPTPAHDASVSAAVAHADTPDTTRNRKWRKPMADAANDDSKRLRRTMAQMGGAAAAASLITYFVAAWGAGERPRTVAGERESTEADERAGATSRAAGGVRVDDALAEALARAKAAETSVARAEARLEALEQRLDTERDSAELDTRRDDGAVRDPLEVRDDEPRRADDAGMKDPWGVPAAPAGGKGRINVVCSPNCDQIVIDGTSVGPSPVLNRALAAGRHTIEGRYQGRTKSAVVVVEAGTIRQVRMLMADSRDRGF